MGDKSAFDSQNNNNQNLEKPESKEASGGKGRVRKIEREGSRRRGRGGYNNGGESSSQKIRE